MYGILMAIDPQAERLLEGIIDGFTAIPEMAWDHIEQAGDAPFYNLGWLAGLMVLLALVVGLPLRGIAIVLAIAILVSFVAS